MKISPEQFEYGILQQLAKGKIPDESYGEKYGVTAEEFGNVVIDMKKKHFLKGEEIYCGISGQSRPDVSLKHAKITVNGEKFIQEHVSEYREMI